MSEETKKAIDASGLDVVVPEDSKFDLSNFLQPQNAGDGIATAPPLSSIARRHLLYFDEFIPVYLILRTTHSEKSTLLSYIDRLTIALEVLAFTPHPKSEHGRFPPQHSAPSPNHDIIWSDVVDRSQEPIIVARHDHQLEAIWKIVVILNRPRVRLSSPSILFRPSGSSRRSRPASSTGLENQYLASGIPTSVNLLESIKDEAALKGVVPRLPALRLSRINTTNSNHLLIDQAISVISQQEFRAVSALTARIRYSRANSVTGRPTIIASLDIETGTLIDHDVSIESIHMRLSEGTTEDMGRGIASALPITCRPRDNPTFLFRLASNALLSGITNPNSNSNTSSRTLDISINATVLATKSCRPRIEMRWRSSVDFSTFLNPTFGVPSQPLQRSKRPENISMAHVFSNETGTAGPGQGPNSESTQSLEQGIAIGHLGVSMTLTAPKEIFVGEPFCWDIFVVNRSNVPRKLAVAVIPKRKKGDLRAHLSKSSNSSSAGRHDPKTAEAVVDENLLYAMQRNVNDAVHIVSLSNDLKIGPLVPGSCFNGELKFLPLAKGVLQVEALRVIEAITNESIDVRELPEIIATERPMNSKD